MHFGVPKVLEKEIYTRLLKGILAIEATSFPDGTTGKYYIAYYNSPF